ncbi:unnamed protein product, partial [Meganyctiphanes norvegica]
MSDSTDAIAQNGTSNHEEIKKPRDKLTIDEAALIVSLLGLLCLLTGNCCIRELSYIWSPDWMLCILGNWFAGWMAARLIHDAALSMFNIANDDVWFPPLKKLNKENQAFVKIFGMGSASFIFCFLTW